MVTQNTDRMVDAELWLHDSDSAVTADALCTVGGQAADGIIDIGAVDRVVDVVVDISAIDVASNDEDYELQVLGSNSASFASGVELLGMLHVGALEALAGGTGGVDVDTAVGRRILTVRNRTPSAVYRYIRMNVEVVAGTTPSITFNAFVSKLTAA